MFARLRRRFGRVDVDGEESRMNQTKPKSNGGHRTWSCGMGSKFWAVYVELPVRGVCGGLPLAFIAMGHNHWNISTDIEFHDYHNS